MTEIDATMAEDRTAPLGLWMYADSYLDAANCVMAHSRHPHREPVYLLYAHAIEFGFKAFLRAKGLSITEIEAHGHGLGSLLTEAHAQGLKEPGHIAKIGEAAIGLLELGDTDTRYIRTGFKRRPDLPALRLFAEWLLRESETYCVPRGKAKPLAG
jgi:hypothetical protein